MAARGGNDAEITGRVKGAKGQRSFGCLAGVGRHHQAQRGQNQHKDDHAAG
jgi:hypothetical protein